MKGNVFLLRALRSVSVVSTCLCARSSAGVQLRLYVDRDQRTVPFKTFLAALAGVFTHKFILLLKGFVCFYVFYEV
jgi:hypothetical protein